MPQKKNEVTWILVFDFELFIGVQCLCLLEKIDLGGR